MDYDTTWTEFAVNNTDTAWFCSPHCKESYTANPAKYNKKQEQKEDKKG
jgi:YHS domain-containing protein